MNPKVVKLREEREKNCEKISRLQARNKSIDADIISIENTDIIGMVRESGLTPDMLADLIQSMKKAGISAAAPMVEEKEGNGIE